MVKTWFITGATRGIGAEIVKAALAAGDNVAATGRNVEALRKALPASDALLCLALDVTDRAQIAAAVETTLARFGRIDVLVNNAGFGLLGLFEETAPGDAEHQFATNVFGLFDSPARCYRPCARSVAVTSSTSPRSRASAAALAPRSIARASTPSRILESLSPRGRAVRHPVTLIEPGFFRTDFLDPSSLKTAPRTPVADYAEASKAIHEGYAARNHQQAGDPAKLAAVTVRLANEPNPPLRFAAGSDAVEVVTAKIARLQGDLDAWRSVSVSTTARSSRPDDTHSPSEGSHPCAIISSARPAFSSRNSASAR